MTNGARVYEITIRGAASDLVRFEFEDVELLAAGGRTCLRTGPVDQSTLFGLLRRVEDLGLVLLEIDTIEAVE